MAVSRPFLLALLGVLLLFATFFASRNAREQGAESSAKPAAQQAVRAPEKSKPEADRRAGEARPDRPAAAREPKPKAARPRSHSHELAKPAAVSRAVGRGNIVVLAFFQSGASDDSATSRAVSSVKGKGVAVFTDRIENVGLYGPLVGGLGVSQAPSVVVIRKDRKAELIQGYVDAETLAQEVADARR